MSTMRKFLTWVLLGLPSFAFPATVTTITVQFASDNSPNPFVINGYEVIASAGWNGITTWSGSPAAMAAMPLEAGASGTPFNSCGKNVFVSSLTDGKAGSGSTYMVTLDWDDGTTTYIS